MKKNQPYLEGFLLLLAHLILLCWIIYTLRESGILTFTEVLGNFMGMAIYGGLLIWFTAYRFRKHP
ncbi:MAG: hypothetical protein OXB84_03025 [Halobacteriovoraceae bacterium]|nr:hypothetical protein [Halobacteriovoraceae bacterium]